MKLTIEAICTGTARPFNGVELSAIAKRPREGVVQLLDEGFAPDEQADRRVHGGPEMAVHLYPLDHHDFWRERVPEPTLLDQPGAFGSNLAVRGVSEGEVHIGDRFRLGSAVIEISQPRQPCWKIEHRFARKGMLRRIIAQRLCGWYFRVIEEGESAPGSQLELVDEGHRGWSVTRVFAALIDPSADVSREELSQIADLDRLSPVWREKALASLAR